MYLSGKGQGSPAFAIGGVGIGDDNEGVGIDFLNLELDGGDLLVRHDEEEHVLVASRVESAALDACGGAVEGGEDEVAEFSVGLLGNDEHELVVLCAVDDEGDDLGRNEDGEEGVEGEVPRGGCGAGIGSADAQSDHHEAEGHDDGVAEEDAVGEAEAGKFL